MCCERVQSEPATRTSHGVLSRGEVLVAGVRSAAAEPTRLPVVAQGQAVLGIDGLAPGGLRNGRGNRAGAAVSQPHLNATHAEGLQPQGVTFLNGWPDLREDREGPGIIRHALPLGT